MNTEGVLWALLSPEDAGPNGVLQASILPQAGPCEAPSGSPLSLSYIIGNTPCLCPPADLSGTHSVPQLDLSCLHPAVLLSQGKEQMLCV